MERAKKREQKEDFRTYPVWEAFEKQKMGIISVLFYTRVKKCRLYGSICNRLMFGQN